MLLNYYNQQKIGALAVGRPQQSDIINCHFYSKKNNNNPDNLSGGFVVPLNQWMFPEVLTTPSLLPSVANQQLLRSQIKVALITLGNSLTSEVTINVPATGI